MVTGNFSRFFLEPQGIQPLPKQKTRLKKRLFLTKNTDFGGKMSEIDIQNEIRIALSEYSVTFRANVGVFFTRDGRPIRTGLPKGFSDLFGFRKSDGRIFFLEVKTEKGKLSESQKHFLESMKNLGAIVGVARSPKEAIEIITTGK
jgi:hypothetical protein